MLAFHFLVYVAATTVAAAIAASTAACAAAMVNPAAATMYPTAATDTATMEFIALLLMVAIAKRP